MADENMNITIAVILRQFFRDLFGSRLVARCEEELLRARADADRRSTERDRYEAELRDELYRLRSKCAQYEMALIPLVSPAASFLAPKREPPTFEPVIEPGSWEAIQQDWERQQAEIGAVEETPDGIRSEIGEKVQQ